MNSVIDLDWFILGPDPDPRNKEEMLEWKKYECRNVINNEFDEAVQQCSGSGSRWAKITTKIEKSKKMYCFEVLDVLFWRLEASPVTWTSLKEA